MQVNRLGVCKIVENNRDDIWAFQGIAAKSSEMIVGTMVLNYSSLVVCALSIVLISPLMRVSERVLKKQDWIYLILLWVANEPSR